MNSRSKSYFQSVKNLPMKLCPDKCLLKSSCNFKSKNRVNLERVPCIIKSIYKKNLPSPIYLNSFCPQSMNLLTVADTGSQWLPETSRALKVKGNYFISYPWKQASPRREDFNSGTILGQRYSVRF